MHVSLLFNYTWYTHIHTHKNQPITDFSTAKIHGITYVSLGDLCQPLKAPIPPKNPPWGRY